MYAGTEESGRESKEAATVGEQANRPMTSSEFIAKRMKNGTTPILNMATAYFRAGLKRGSINKVGADLYVERPAAVAGAEEQVDGGDPMSLRE